MPQYIYYQGKQYPVPIQYSLPKGINAAEAGVLIDGSADVDDILSLIYEWVNNRIIKVDSTDTSIKFTKLKELPETAKPYEQTLFNKLFSGQKININQIRIEILDYCFKMGWIEDPFGGEVTCVTNDQKKNSSGNKIEDQVGGKIICNDEQKKQAKSISMIILYIFLFIFFLRIILFLRSISPVLIISIVGIGIIIIATVFNGFKYSKPVYIFLSYSTLYLHPKYGTPKCQSEWLPSYEEPYSTTPLTQKGKLLKSHISGYKKYLKKIKITTKTSRIDDGTLKDRISLGVNNSGYIIDSIKKYQVNKKEFRYDVLFKNRINEWMSNWEKEHNCTLSYYQHY